MKKIGIVGFGRFGVLLASLAQEIFEVHVVEADPSRAKQAEAGGYNLIPFGSLPDMDYIFLAVPISGFEAVLQQLAPIVTNSQVVIDLCSVKVYPVALMQRYLPNCQILGSHPMFGPDSAKSGLAGLQVALCPVRVSPDDLAVITEFWSRKGIEVSQTTPEAHDHDTVYSQAFTYTVAHIIHLMKLPEVTYRTRSFNAITEVASLSKNDSDQLFHDMLYYNPYFTDMKQQLETSLAETQQVLAAIEQEQRSASQAGSSESVNDETL